MDLMIWYLLMLYLPSPIVREIKLDWRLYCIHFNHTIYPPCRMRECTEATLQEAVAKTKQLTEENHREILSIIEKGVALRIKDAQITTGHR